MSEMAEHFRAMRQERQAQRGEALQIALDAFQAAADAVTEANPRCVLVQSTENHWLVRCEGAAIWAWWPSSHKTQALPSGRVCHHSGFDAELNHILRRIKC